MLSQYLNQVRQTKPRIHCITNAVSAPLSANGLMAIGGAPMMADAPEEAAEITALCDGLSLNLGMPNPQKLSAMFAAGAAANRRRIPVVFDPVGVGVSQFRRESAQKLLDEIKFTAIRGNLSEMRVLAGVEGNCLGVDAGDGIDEKNLAQVARFAKDFAQKTGAIIAISSAIDLVADGAVVYVVRNGTPMLSQLSGSGCLLSALLTAYLASNPERQLEGAVTALCAMGLCGEKAAKISRGNGSFAMNLLEELGNLTGEILEQGAEYEIF